MATAAPVPLGPTSPSSQRKPSHPLNLLQGSLPGARDTGRLAGLPVCRAEATLRHLQMAGCQKAWPSACDGVTLGACGLGICRNKRPNWDGAQPQ